ncbi:hypothetical protein RJ639_006168 [Escallonia herrerae]|uniref:RRM domain-containing protein n=1 Tax=Escallonia herrerae TaxID=1293975 RepID=A0AA88W111_9ASTE|nr:hypothetical protein RJ639_006168 [Escallonia herrerae]
MDTFVKYFGRYGEIIDSVIMKDRHTGRPRGFGFITYADPSVVDTVIAEMHVINGKQYKSLLKLGLPFLVASSSPPHSSTALPQGTDP